MSVGRIAGDEHEVGAQSGRDAAAVAQAVDARRRRGRGAQRGRRRQPGLDQQLELAVQARRRAPCRGSARRCRRGSARRRRRAASWRRRRAPGSACEPGRLREAALERRALGGRDERRETRVGDERGPAGDAGRALGHRQRRRDEGAARRRPAARTPASAGASAKMCTSPLAPAAIASSAPCARADVNHGELAARLRGGDRRRRVRARSMVGDLHAVRRAVVVDDLDVVGALGDPRVDEGLRVGGRGERRESACRTRCRGPSGAVTSVPAEKRSARPERRRPPAAVRVRIVAAHAVVGEHVELGRHAEDERALERIAEGMRVRVDEARQERPALAGDRLDAGGHAVSPDADDRAVAHVHARLRR